MKVGLACGIIAAAVLGVAGIEPSRPTFFWQRSNYQPSVEYNKPSYITTPPSKPLYFGTSPTKPAYFVSESAKPVITESIKPEVELESSKPAIAEYYKPSVSEYSKPLASEYPKPAVPEYPKPVGQEYPKPVGQEYPKPVGQEYPKPVGQEYPKPEVQEYPKPEVQEYPKPEVQVYPKPAVSEYPKPTVPEYPKPAVPEYPKPTIPEYNKPSVSEYPKPAVSEYNKPAVPEYPKPVESEYPKPVESEYPKPVVSESSKPTVPEYPKPSVSETSKPAVPELGINKPSISEYSKPQELEPSNPSVSEYPKPSVSESAKPVVPEYPKPTAPEYPKPGYSKPSNSELESETSKPSVPEYSKPLTSEYSKPSVSDDSKPLISEISKPELESYKPSEPEKKEPSKPSVPEIESRFPEIESTKPSSPVWAPNKPFSPFWQTTKPSSPVWQPVKPSYPIWSSNKPSSPVYEPTTELIKETEATVPPTTFYTNNYVPYWSHHHVLPFEHHEPCKYEITDQTFLDYRYAVYNMSTPLYKKVAAVTGAHFVFSPQTIWLTLAALAEGTSGPARQQLFNYLQLPENICQREAYYHLATTREHTGNDIVFARNRLFVADSNVHVNKKWEDYVKSHHNLNTVVVPYKTNPVVEIGELKKVFNVQLPNINLNGNSLVLESLDYQGLWTSVFSDAVIEQGPFYNSYGEQIGFMDYMKVVKRANVGVIPSLNMKVIDLPVGREGRYRMYFAVSLSPKDNYDNTLQRIENSLVLEAVVNLKQSLKPVEIVIPKIKMTSELDMRQLLEQIGVKSLWTDPQATRNISEPAALPSAFTQRVTVTIDDGGVRPAVQEYQNFVPPLHYQQSSYKPGYTAYPSSAPWSSIHDYKPVEASFVANKPFMFGLFDSQSFTGLIYGSFSKPH